MAMYDDNVFFEKLPFYEVAAGNTTRGFFDRKRMVCLFYKV